MSNKDFVTDAITAIRNCGYTLSPDEKAAVIIGTAIEDLAESIDNLLHNDGRLWIANEVGGITPIEVLASGDLTIRKED